MSPPPPRPSAYHITHLDNLPRILADGTLYSDAVMAVRGGPTTSIGMSEIKKRRLQLPVQCHPGTKVGEYVPFNFCPRSVMLYVIHRANHPELEFKGGQGQILHLEADLHSVVAWADGMKRRWAYSLSNASARYTEFDCTISGLHRINWEAVRSNEFSDPDIKEGKQAEFLVHEVPWSLITRIGVHSQQVKLAVDKAIQSITQRPTVQIIPGWYF